MYRFRQKAVPLGALVAMAIAAYLLVAKGRSDRAAETPKDQRARLNELKLILERTSDECRKQTHDYASPAPRNLHDLSASSVAILEKVPFVTKVDVLLKAEAPTARIVHLLDWHYVPKDLYAIDLKHSHERELSDKEIDDLHEVLLLEVEAVQEEQLAIARCLIKHHGLRRIFSEGFSPREQTIWKAKVAAVESVEKEDVPRIKAKLKECDEIIAGNNAERSEKAKEIKRQLLMLLNEHRMSVLQLGTVGRLAMAGEIEEVIGVEDEKAHHAARPITEDGQVKPDPEKIKARQDAQAKTMLESGPFALVILGGSHDLTASLKKLGGGRAEYIQVKTRRYREFAED